MASLELMLVCKIINDGSIKEAIEWGITEDDFLANETKTVYTYILQSFKEATTSGTIVGPLLAKQIFSNLPLEQVDPKVTLGFLCQEVRNKRICIEASTRAQEVIALAAEGKGLAAISKLQEGANTCVRMDGGKNTDVDAKVGLDLVVDRYKKRESGQLPDVMTWPWQPVQDRVGGVQKSDYIIIYGRPKSMKTWVLTYFLHWATLLQASDKRVLVYTKEMIVEDIYDRWASIIGAVDFNEMRLARLPEEIRNRFIESIEVVRDTISSGRLTVLSAKDVAGRDTVSWLRTKIDKYGPHVAFVDGMYLMSPEDKRISKPNEKVASISRAMRQMILDTHVPVIATLQANRDAAKHDRAELDEIAFTDAISQDCTAAIRVINNMMNNNNDKAKESTISLIVGGSRNWNVNGWKIYGIPGSNFEFVDFMSEKSVQLAKMGDNTSEAPATTKPNGKGRTHRGNNEAMHIANDIIKNI